MLYGTNFPEGFRAGMTLRGFNLGTTGNCCRPGNNPTSKTFVPRSRAAF